MLGKIYEIPSWILQLMKWLSDFGLTESIEELIKSLLSNEDTPYNIGLLGPSRIGKTTLIASMIQEFRDYSKELPPDSGYIKLEAQDEATNSRLSTRINDLKSGIIQGEFQTGTLEGTSTHEVFNLCFEEAKNNSFKQKFSLHDFPGGWINDPTKIEALGMKNWDIIILPIDAAIIMESVEKQQKRYARNSLGIDQVEKIIRDWSVFRDGKPGLCILAPVKCETYFTEPRIAPFLYDKSQLLYNKITQEYYKETIDIIKEKKNIACSYMPVNTIGCCYLKSPTWSKDGVFGGYYAISPEPGMDSWKPHGPSYIILEICDFIAMHLKKIDKLKDNDKIKSFINATTLMQGEMNKSVRGRSPYKRTIIIQRGSF